MWLLVMLFLAIFSTAAWYMWSRGDEYRMDVLALISWGTVIMVFADHLMGYIEEGEFMEMSLDALVLGLTMAATALLIWLAVLLIRDPKGKIRKITVPRA